MIMCRNGQYLPKTAHDHDGPPAGAGWEARGLGGWGA